MAGRIRCCRLVFPGTLATLIACLAGTAMADPVSVEIEKKWSGSLPVKSLKMFPEKQQNSRVAYVSSQEKWKSLWTAFGSPGELPKVDFEKHLVVVAKNTGYLNRISVASAALDNGVLRVDADETKSARRIVDTVYCGILIVPRKGITRISDGAGRTIDVRPIPALTGAVQVRATEMSFENVTAWVRLWEYDPFLADVAADLSDDVKLANLKHQSGRATTIRFEVGDKARINPERHYYVTVFLYRDGKVGDNASRVYFLDGFNKVKLPGKIDGTLRRLNR